MAKQKKGKRYRGFRIFVKVQLILMLLVVGAVAFYYLGGYAKKVNALKKEAHELVNASDDDTFRATQTSLVYDAQGDLISVLKGEKDKYYLEYSQIPESVCDALVCVEDKKFYQHNGVDFKGILRAAIAMIQNGKVTQGGSTITQQLARNVFLTQEKTWERKVEEIFIAVKMEEIYPKEKILEYYINNIYFANGYYGIQAASRGYFNKDAKELNLSETAFLCAIPNNPTLYDPEDNYANTLERRDRILEQMYEDGIITVLQYQTEKNRTIVLNRPEEVKHDYVETYTYYCATRALMAMEGFQFRTTFDDTADRNEYEAAYEELYETCNKKLYTSGYRIYTSIDLAIQNELQKSIDTTLAGYTEVNEEGIYTLQSAGVCIDNQTGCVRAIVGGRTQEHAGYTINRAYKSYRQPGSAIKPLLVYTPALEGQYNPDTIVQDVPIDDGPSNSGGTYAGDITLRSAVAYSKNTIAWKLLEELTPKKGLDYLHKMNFAKIDDVQDNRLVIALGGMTYGVSPLEMAVGYSTIENDGFYREPTCILKITDAKGQIIYQHEQEEEAIYGENASRMMTDMLRTVVTDGTGRGLALSNMPCAGKTGTTNDNKDGWFVGYTRYYTTSVWVGYDMPQKLDGLSGASYPGGIWHRFMSAIHEGLTPQDFPAYSDVPVEVDEQPEAEEADAESEEVMQEDVLENIEQ